MKTDAADPKPRTAWWQRPEVRWLTPPAIVMAVIGCASSTQAERHVGHRQWVAIATPLAAGVAGAAVLSASVGWWWRRGLWDLTAVALVGGYLFAGGSYLAWDADPGTTTCPGPQPCDTAYGVAALFGGTGLALLLAGAAIASARWRRKSRR